jgi:hypothetical protein
MRYGHAIFISSLLLAVGSASSGAAVPRVGLYGVFERHVTNGKRYSNPFDFQVVELKTRFTAPSGKTVSLFGFHDGDGKGGQKGPVWTFRFMPDEVGRWQYSYTWTDGTAGGSGASRCATPAWPAP